VSGSWLPWIVSYARLITSPQPAIYGAKAALLDIIRGSAERSRDYRQSAPGGLRATVRARRRGIHSRLRFDRFPKIRVDARRTHDAAVRTTSVAGITQRDYE